ncbi:hypothetical protein JCGZ_19404 [Jatropha curcas]|uniref:rhamnogalacturonan endolyase n=1 Tax=Jatropha curcas TaxID=180498 RepID=A0A067JZB5_JATCU|nr:hypothetical protein JCGZ_19404 [Jatropha curcas]
MTMKKSYSICMHLEIFACIWLLNVMQVSLCSPLNFSHRKILTSRLSSGVVLREEPKFVVIDNGIVRVTLSKPGGFVTGIKYNGVENILETKNDDEDRGLHGANFSVITKNEDQVEVSFNKKWNISMKDNIVPLNIDKRFNYMAVSDNIQRIMPTFQDRQNSQALAYPEAVLLTKTSNPKLRGEVDDKYQYSMDRKDSKVHGWISQNSAMGIWVIRPSDEFCTGGPFRQELTSHAGPCLLSMFTSSHYLGKYKNTKYEEPWKMVFGPVYIYLNSNSTADKQALWNDAKRQMSTEVESWPYNFTQSKDFSYSDKRGTASGQITIINEGNSKLANGAYVGLAAPGDVDSWQFETKGYQFWTQADNEGCFTIENIRVGTYNLYAWVPGFVGNYKYGENITITPGSNIKLGVLNYESPRNGPTIWEIGYPDRSAAEFFVPDPESTLTNKLFINQPTEKFRQYGLWERYTNLYPTEDLVYNVGTSNCSRDWFFIHVPRNTGKDVYKPTTWQITFELETVIQTGNYTLQLALASATEAEIQVRFNDPNAKRPLFTTGLIGKDNAIARHGIHGIYWFYTIDVPNDVLVNGKNTIYLTQTRVAAIFHGVMYDYIRLEGPTST